jgi:hypothetical protein
MFAKGNQASSGSIGGSSFDPKIALVVEQLIGVVPYQSSRVALGAPH